MPTMPIDPNVIDPRAQEILEEIATAMRTIDAAARRFFALEPCSSAGEVLDYFEAHHGLIKAVIKRDQEV